jgi:hypothetical protein
MPHTAVPGPALVIQDHPIRFVKTYPSFLGSGALVTSPCAPTADALEPVWGGCTPHPTVLANELRRYLYTKRRDPRERPRERPLDRR